MNRIVVSAVLALFFVAGSNDIVSNNVSFSVYTGNLDQYEQIPFDKAVCMKAQ